MERLIRPLDIDNFVTSPGGRFLSRRGNVYHFASDYPVASGLPIYASNSGTLSDATNSQCGNGVQIVGDKNSPYITGYCHLEKFSPEIEQELNLTGSAIVKQGDIIGYTGSTGKSTGPHLHFKVRNKATGVPMDPELINYRKYNYAGINWFSVFFGIFSALAIIHAYGDEKRRAKK